jgi:hypothetical protein
LAAGVSRQYPNNETYEQTTDLHLELHEEESLAEIRNLRRQGRTSYLAWESENFARQDQTGRSFASVSEITAPALEQMFVRPKVGPAGLERAIVLEKKSGLIRHVLFTPEDPAEFKRVLDEAITRFRQNPKSSDSTL